MKKITLALMAFMLVLGMTQCKKEQQNNIIPDEGETVYITMKVADDGGKHTVYPGTGAVVYGNGDKIYVGNNGHYVGTLTYANGAFSGSITSPSTSDYLHFYFTGGKTPANNPTTNTTSFTVNISDQSTNLPVLSYGRSKTKYVDGTTSYVCMLENKCGLVKFVPSEATSNPISVSGMKTTATINFATPGITPTDATGAVTLYSVSGSEKWAILLPQDEVANATALVPNCLTETFTVPAISNNSYVSGGITMTIISGLIFGKFTINSSGQQVYFSQGNLQYRASTNTWQFAANQYEYIGSDNSNISSTYNGWIDLFGWGTSGWDSGNTYYHPWDSNDYSDAVLYGPAGYYDLTGSYANADWGVYNPISNGGNQTNQWRTLTSNEWDYVFNKRTSPSGIRYAKAKVNNVNGVILLPNAWSSSTYNLNYTNTAGASFSSNTLTASQWSTLEQAGAVFLPAAGARRGSSVSSTGSYLLYWSASNAGNTDAYGLNISDSSLNATNMNFRSDGRSVRLVRDVQ